MCHEYTKGAKFHNKQTKKKVRPQKLQTTQNKKKKIPTKNNNHNKKRRV